MSKPVIEFWFDFSSSYAYFAALEIGNLADKHGYEVLWRPFMLGTAFEVTGARGLSRTPLKREYARHDWARIARHRKAPFQLPEHHPSIALPATRAYYFLEENEPKHAVPFAKAVFSAYFQARLDTADAVAVADVAASVGADRHVVLSGLGSPEIKALAQARSEEAIAKGVFGSPWFFVDGEPFWGWDRLPMIDDWLSCGGW
jgi:2-hydroxychromene-2-carboxylate isomerase